MSGRSGSTVGVAPWPLALWGLFVWAAVYVLVRAVGHVLLDPSNTLLLAGFFVSALPLMALATYPVYWRLDVGSKRRAGAAGVMSLPGMSLHVVLLLFAGALLPDLNPGSVVNFGAILLFGYAVVLLTGLVSAKR